jgi:Holliday junction DNA helicase RuvB
MDDTQNNFTSPGPPTLDHVIGQKRAVQQLRVALDAHYNDRAMVPSEEIALAHLLLVGPPGVGKSLLGSIVARELGSQFHEELAQNLATPGHMAGLLMLAEAGAVIFVDEIHELPATVQTTLYRSLEERRLFLGGDRKSVSLPAFCFIGATTDEWALTKPLRDRFKITLRLEHYSEKELCELLKQRAKQLRWPITDEAVREIASRGRGTPRLAIRLMEAAWRQARSIAESTLTEHHVRRMCGIEGVDSLGLDCTERRYLELLREGQGPVRLNVIATQLALPRRTVEKVIESELIRLGLVSKAEEGRLLTALGAKHLTENSGQ